MKVAKNNPIIPSAAALLIQDNKVLLVRALGGSRHLIGMYGLPSGEVDNGETEREAAAREFCEETGLFTTSQDISEFPNNFYHASIPRKDGTIKTFSWRVFLVKNYSGEIKIEEDKNMPEWVEISKLKELEQQKKLLPNTLNAVNAAM